MGRFARHYQCYATSGTKLNHFSGWIGGLHCSSRSPPEPEILSCVNALRLRFLAAERSKELGRGCSHPTRAPGFVTAGAAGCSLSRRFATYY